MVPQIWHFQPFDTVRRKNPAKQVPKTRVRQAIDRSGARVAWVRFGLLRRLAQKSDVAHADVDACRSSMLRGGP